MHTTASKHGIPDSYFALNRAFPLRPIHSEGEFDRAMARLIELAKAKPADEMDAGERDYFEAMTTLVQRFERDRRQSCLPKLTPLDRLVFLMREHAMTVNDLGQILGSQPTASLILRGKRSMSKSHILKLAGHFNVSPALFLI